ncbi:GNAT family N-acetyltransferase [Daejeonia sp. YH14]|uniref:GNAT family N-acetyltransferase n=1 Tax=Daejeonia sp. YH14 TaxID=3439042 RepID=UPI003F49983A
MTAVRKAHLNDLPQLAELFDHYRQFYHKTSDLEGARFFLYDRLQKKDSEIFVVELGTHLAGFTQLYPIFSSTRMKRYWLLNDLFVREDFRGHGYARKLIAAAKEHCKNTSACGILLETDKTNNIGNRLYPSCGFRFYDHAHFYEWENTEIESVKNL